MHTKLFTTAALTFACLNVQAADMPVHLPAVSDTMRGKTFTITPTHIRRLDQLEELAMDLGTYRQKLNLCKSHELRDFDKLLRQVDEKLERADFNNGFLVKVYRSRFKQGEERSLVYAALLHPDFRSGYCRGIGGFVSGTAENKKELTQRTYKVITQVENAFNVDTRETQINTGY
ncbi:MAG: hypothetical protein VX730_08245 [Pseudomonadota bacterium]|nr:hypothetical protein [Pseudomonadota bacterium]